ncbi:MAG: outer membrane protein assembly factor BamB family protein [Acidimicrobiales bacterium]
MWRRMGVRWLAAGLAVGIGVPALASGGARPLPAVRAVAGCSDNWPMFQHDATHSASTSCTSVSQLTVPTLHPAWFTSMPGGVTAEPVVADGLVYVGDSTGVFDALNQSTGKAVWSFNITSNAIHNDKHGASFGEIPGTAAVVEPSALGGAVGSCASGDPTVFVVGGGTVYALDASSGAPCWAQDADPAHPTSAVETESSPVVDTATSPPELLLGDDTNQSGGVAQTGMLAFDALNGDLLWKYEPETDTVVTPMETCTGYPLSNPCQSAANNALSEYDNQPTDLACGDVWSSPALDVSRGLVIFATGDCPKPNGPQFSKIESVFALDVISGQMQWDFPEPLNAYDQTNGNDGDTDFGASPIITATDDSAGNPIVVEAGKSGFVYGLDEVKGTKLWAVQAAQPGQLSPQLVGAIGGFIGAPALGTANGQAAVFLSSAVFTPLRGSGLSTSKPYEQCPPVADKALPLCPDDTLVGAPERLASVHAVSVATGQVLWQEPISTPTYSPATYANGVVFVPSTTSFAAEAYNADNGLPLWSFPLAASAPGGGASIVGSSIYLGSGVSESGFTAAVVHGVWSFTLGTGGIPPALNGLP